MFFSYEDEKFKFTGRWGKEQQWVSGICATACGSKIEFGFKGRDLVLHFNTNDNVETYPHLYISIDGGARIEVTLQKLIRVDALTDTEHTATIIFKSAVEAQHRWYSPLNGKVAFEGVTVNELIAVSESKKKTIEFVGDSITEGVLIDVDFVDGGQQGRPFHDDVTATYAYLTAEALDLEPYIMGYGAVGVTKSGQGAVPKCAEAYPYCFENVPKSYSNCDYIMINHGANDRGVEVETYLENYKELLDLIIKENPKSKIIVLSAFCGAFHIELGEFVEKYNKENDTNISYIDSFGWVPLEPLHPLRSGHRIIAEKLIPQMKKIIL